MDPLEGVKIEKDTTFALMLGASRRGHKTFYLPDGGITRENGVTSFHVQEVRARRDAESPFEIIEETLLEEDAVDVLWIRTDPPFSGNYLTNTWLLDLLPESVVTINSPSGIRTVNEKIWATQFTEVTPPTLVGRAKADLTAFLREHDVIIVKPTDGFGGQGVFRLASGEKNVNVTLEMLTGQFTKDIIAQKYIPEAEDGDKRILLLDGEPLGAVLRLHGQDDHRNNFFSGGKPYATDITGRDLEVIAALKPHLKKLGLYFVGIDMLGDYLVEVNVTSPTCLQEMNILYDCRLEDKVIEFSENLVDRARVKS